MVGDRVEVRLLEGWTAGVVEALRASTYTGEENLTRVDVRLDDGRLFPGCHPACVRAAEWA